MKVKIFTNLRRISVLTLSLMLLLVLTDAEAASRRNCNRNLVVNEVMPLDFGYFVGSIAGTVTVSPNGARSSTGPVLVGGGSVSPGVFELYTTISGCESYSVRVRFNNGSLSGSGPNMSVRNMVSNPASQTFSLNPGSNNPITVTVGADLLSATSQAAGPYNGTYRVRFNLR